VLVIADTSSTDAAPAAAAPRVVNFGSDRVARSLAERLLAPPREGSQEGEVEEGEEGVQEGGRMDENGRKE
jgi:hypothetical protein